MRSILLIAFVLIMLTQLLACSGHHKPVASPLPAAPERWNDGCSDKDWAWGIKSDDPCDQRLLQETK